jgi:uncharacterized membrane protein YoaK (UPF0700 family)
MPPEPLPPAAFFIGPALAFTAGFADAGSFVGAGGVFCAHMTGNFVVLAADLASGTGEGGWLKLATFPIFVATVLGATWAHRRFGGGAGPSAARSLLAVKSALLGAAALVACLAPSTVPGPCRTAIVALMVIAMGIQNTVHRLHPELGPMTTVMTGNVTGWLVDAVPPVAPAGAPRRRLVGMVIVAFTVGCAAGGVGVARLGFVVLVLPAVVALLVRARLPREAGAGP